MPIFSIGSLFSPTGRGIHMFSFHASRLFISLSPIDLRKGHYGLLAEVKKYDISLEMGDIVIFLNKSKRDIKFLLSDSNGLWVFHKKFLSKNIKTKISQWKSEGLKEIKQEDLSMLLAGCSYEKWES